MFIVFLENIGEDLWYLYRSRAAKLGLIKILWIAMAVIGGMATQELLKVRWQTTFVEAFPEYGKGIATFLSFFIGFLFALVPEGSITTFIAGSSTKADQRRAIVGSFVSIALSLSACAIFVAKRGVNEESSFAIALSVTGQFFIFMLSKSLKDNERNEAIVEKETEMREMREIYRNRRMQKHRTSRPANSGSFPTRSTTDKQIPGVPQQNLGNINFD